MNTCSPRGPIENLISTRFFVRVDITLFDEKIVAERHEKSSKKKLGQMEMLDITRII
jgi:hypothetical protein